MSASKKENAGLVSRKGGYGWVYEYYSTVIHSCGEKVKKNGLSVTTATTGLM